MIERQILSNPDRCGLFCHCASLTPTPQGDLLLAWYAYPAKETQSGVLVLARKPSGRARFDLPRRILEDWRSSLGNPVLFCDHTGRLHLIFVSLRGHYWDSAITYQVSSDDHGATWSVPEAVRVPKGTMVRHPPIARQDGHYLMAAYDEQENTTMMLTASPEATGWTVASRLTDMPAIQGCLVRQGGSDLTMILRPCGNERVCLRSISVDDGRTWSSPVRTTLPNPLSGTAAFAVGDELCVVHNHTTEHRRYPLSLSWSTDRGMSWAEPIHIDETRHELSYPSFFVDHDGIVHGAYTFGRNRIQYVSFDQGFGRK